MTNCSKVREKCQELLPYFQSYSRTFFFQNYHNELRPFSRKSIRKSFLWFFWHLPILILWIGTREPRLGCFCLRIEGLILKIAQSIRYVISILFRFLELFKHSAEENCKQCWHQYTILHDVCCDAVSSREDLVTWRCSPPLNCENLSTWLPTLVAV